MIAFFKNNILLGIVRLIFAALLISGAYMHFTISTDYYNNEFIDYLSAANYMWQLIGAIILVAGIGILFNKTLVLASLLALPITFNILALHLHYFTLDGLFIGVVMFGLNVILLYYCRGVLRNLFDEVE